MTTDPRLEPTEIHAPRGADWFEVRWADGAVTRLSNRLLRGYCPCAGCQGHTGSIRYRPVGEVSLETIEEVGNYGLSLGWSDGHSSGIYSFKYLRELASLPPTDEAERPALVRD